MCAILAVFLLAGCASSAGGGGGPTLAPVTTTPVTTAADTSADTSADAAVTGKRVALTFDDGPHNIRTKLIVDELDKYGFHATFFVVGNRVDGSAYNGGEAMVYAYEHGNEIGIHGYTHLAYYHACSDTEFAFELQNTHKVISYRLQGKAPTLMRPIGGSITQERIASCGYAVILWSVDSLDWENQYTYADSETEAERAAKVDAIVENVMSKVRDGSIVLMHDIYESTYDAVCIILARLHAEGYTVVTVSELLSPVAGRAYYSK